MEQDKQGAIIFDFDGTLADSFPIALEIFYALTHIKALEQDDMAHLRGMTLIQIARQLKIPLYHVPFLLFRGRRFMRRRIADVTLFIGVEQVIRDLAKTHKLFILSSNSTRNIQLVLQRYGLLSSFEGIYGGVRLLGKASKLRKIARHFGLNLATTWYVGDEVRDMEAAKAAGLQAVAVSWGYNNIAVLQAEQPAASVITIEELMHVFITTDNNLPS
jgi:phosphoglycolate phosphatase